MIQIPVRNNGIDKKSIFTCFIFSSNSHSFSGIPLLSDEGAVVASEVDELREPLSFELLSVIFLLYLKQTKNAIYFMYYTFFGYSVMIKVHAPSLMTYRIQLFNERDFKTSWKSM